jgi:hypothetical protein
MLAYDYPLLGALLSIMWFFLLVVWIMALFHVIADIFRSKDLGGFAKAMWLLFVIVLPFLGVFVYLLARGDSMAAHSIADAQARESAFRSYVQETAGDPAGEIQKLAALRDQGVISDAEFEAGKAKILG